MGIRVEPPTSTISSLALLEAGVREHLADGAEAILEQVDVELLKPGARERLRKVDAVEQGLDLEPGLVLRRQGGLHALDLAAELLHGPLVLRHVLLVLTLEDLHEVLHDPLVEIFAAEVGVPVGREHLEHAVVDRQEGDVERAAAQVEHQNVLFAALLVEPVRDARTLR